MVTDGYKLKPLENLKVLKISKITKFYEAKKLSLCGTQNYDLDCQIKLIS